MPTQNRREFLQSAAAVGLGFLGLRRLLTAAPAYAMTVDDKPTVMGFGPLHDDPNKLLDLPQGFSYKVISSRGETMSDGLLVPGQPDGMAAFAGPGGKTLLLRNHELLEVEMKQFSPFGKGHAMLDKVPAEFSYDRGFGKTPCIGGVTTIVYDTKSQKLEKQFLTLACTEYNCAGGPTPWNSWISCEETVSTKDAVHEQDHGFPFEVPALPDMRFIKPQPIKTMGRFRREAIAVDPRTGIVYQTEDREDGIITRYIPTKPGELLAGGRLQALVIHDTKSCDLRNWVADNGEYLAPRIHVGQKLAVDWMDLDDILAPKDDLRTRAFASGSARFARAEGMWFGDGRVFFACTDGGRIKMGQLFAYTPSEFEGTPRENEKPGSLELFIEPNDKTLLANADNLTFAPWGDLVVCEDSDETVQHLVGVTPQGKLYKIARHPGKSEFAGSTFSPDGTTLFVNVQAVGKTLAITGPWRTSRA